MKKNSRNCRKDRRSSRSKWIVKKPFIASDSTWVGDSSFSTFPIYKQTLNKRGKPSRWIEVNKKWFVNNVEVTKEKYYQEYHKIIPIGTVLKPMY